MRNNRFVVGALGWDHAGWEGTFYPVDLPVAWRLTYYANEFSGVLVPQASWRSASSDTLAGWLDDVPEQFLFFLEWTDACAAEQTATESARRLGTQYGGLIKSGSALMTSREFWDLRQLRIRFEKLARLRTKAVLPAFFLAGEPPDIERLREAKILAELLVI